MKQLNKYFLDFEQTVHYFLDHIDDGKTQSKVIINEINLKEGCFFTLLPDNAILNKLYDFSGGNMIPQRLAKKRTYNIAGKDILGVEILNIDKELSLFICKYLQNDTENYAMFNHTNARLGDQNINLDGVQTIYNKNDIYYLLSKKNTLEEVENTIKQTFTFWHFLIVLADNLNPINQDLTDEYISLTCVHAKYIITGAYDGEGYIFWERNGKASS